MLLETAGITKTFGGLMAVDSVDLTIEEGELVGLIGPNGAGKTTFFNCMSGVMDPDEGTVRFKGEDITDIQPHRLAKKGLVRTFQRTREFGTMTVLDNVRLSALDHPGERTLPAITKSQDMEEYEREVTSEAQRLIELFDLDHLETEYAANLSAGQRRLLGLARAFMLEPKLCLLDEPFAGVNPSLMNRIAEQIIEWNDSGMAFLIIEHEIETMAELVDRIIVMAEGSILADGTPEAVLNNDEVIDRYMGKTTKPS